MLPFKKISRREQKSFLCYFSNSAHSSPSLRSSHPSRLVLRSSWLRFSACMLEKVFFWRSTAIFRSRHTFSQIHTQMHSSYVCSFPAEIGNVWPTSYNLVTTKQLIGFLLDVNHNLNHRCRTPSSRREVENFPRTFRASVATCDNLSLSEWTKGDGRKKSGFFASPSAWNTLSTVSVHFPDNSDGSGG